MRNGASLVIRGTFIGSLVVALLGWFLAGRINLGSDSEVAYAASPTQVSQPVQPGNPANPCLVSASFPDSILQWCEIITAQASNVDISPNLIAALILQESGGDAEAYSVSGAVGLMQVMARDGLAAAFECINGPCFASRPTIEELKDPAFNVEYGTQMLSGLIDRFGDLRDALKAYGPMDVDYSYADRVLKIYERYR